jgi:hypothetical protein
MCIACELGLLMALDALPDEPPAGFPRPPEPNEAGRFDCDAPDAKPARQTQPSGGEQAP